MGKILSNFIGVRTEPISGDECASLLPLPPLKPRPEKRSATLTLHLTPAEKGVCEEKAGHLPVGEWARNQLTQDHGALDVVREMLTATQTEISAIWLLLLNHPALSTEENLGARKKLLADIRDTQAEDPLRLTSKGGQ